MWTVSVIFLALGFVASTRGHPASGSIARLPEALSIAADWTPPTLPDADVFGNDPLAVEIGHPPTSGNESVAPGAEKHEAGEALSKTGVAAIGGLKGTLGFLVGPEKIQAEPERESLKPTVPPELWTEQTSWHPDRGAATDTVTSSVGLVEEGDARSRPEPNSDLKMRMNANPVQQVGFTIERRRVELKPGKTPTATEEGVSQESEAGHRLEPRAPRTAIVQVQFPVPNFGPAIQRIQQAGDKLQRDALNGITNVATHKPVIDGHVHGGNTFWLLHKGKRWLKRFLTGKKDLRPYDYNKLGVAPPKVTPSWTAWHLQQARLQKQQLPPQQHLPPQQQWQWGWPPPTMPQPAPPHGVFRGKR